MRRTTLHLFVDAVMASAFVALIATGLLLAFILPAGSRDTSIWTLTRHDWGDIHFYLSMTMLAAVALHLTLNWSWLSGAIAKCLPRRAGHVSQGGRWVAAVVLAVLILIMGGFLLAATLSKSPGPGGHPARQRQISHLSTATPPAQKVITSSQLSTPSAPWAAAMSTVRPGPSSL